MTANTTRTLLLILLIGFFGHAISGDSSSENDAPKTDEALTGNAEAGEVRYTESCVNCHGAAGKGVASYPKVSGNEISYTVSDLETYRDGIKIGPNSFLMIMNAKPLTDEEIANLAAYLKEATN